MSSILQFDGSCGPRAFGKSRISRLLTSTSDYFESIDSNTTTTTTDEVETPQFPDTVDFVSQGTQTCICGLLEHDLI